MKRLLQGACAVLAGAGLLLSAGCAGAGYVGGGYYDYDYYPDWDVYYYPQGRLYYWNEAGHWRSGAELPHRYDLHQHRESQRLHLHTAQPWTEHRPAHGGAEHPEEHHFITPSALR